MTTASAPVFDIQSLATRDGQGLRTLVFLQGCPLRCTWCSNPEGQADRPPLRWRRAVCTGDMACRTACRHGAVHIVRAGDAMSAIPAFDRDLCARCDDHACVGQCPSGALILADRRMTADELGAELMKDIRLFWNTGGGLTFGGGEPLLHPDFVVEVAVRIRRYGIGTAIETCGEWDWAAAEAALAAAERIFFDLKTLDPVTHRRLTGRSNENILANLKRLAAAAPEKVVVSLPLIPGLGDIVEHARAVGGFLLPLGLRRVRLLPYHRMGVGKYESLGRIYPHQAWDGDLDPALVTTARDVLAGLGFDVTVE
jgi:pyruvate formate lyase activating enzyme